MIDPVAFKSSLAVVYWTIYHPQYTTPNRNYNMELFPHQGCYVLRVTVFSDSPEACFNIKMVLNRLDYGINNLVFTK